MKDGRESGTTYDPEIIQTLTALKIEQRVIKKVATVPVIESVDIAEIGVEISI